MNNAEYILAMITVLVMFTSMVVSSRKSGYIKGLGIRYKGKYRIERSAFDNYCKIMLMVVIGFLFLCSLFVQDWLTALEFTLINGVFVGYALAWEKLIERGS